MSLVRWSTTVCVSAQRSWVGGPAAPAFAGEVTGNGKSTPIRAGVASSACAFSGIEGGWTLISFEPLTVVAVEGGPGVTQTPHAEPAAGIVHAPGIPGQECRGNTTSNL